MKLGWKKEKISGRFPEEKCHYLSFSFFAALTRFRFADTFGLTSTIYRVFQNVLLQNIFLDLLILLRLSK